MCNSPFERDGKFQPRMLNCGHTFCTHCILSMSHQKSIKCPYCSTTTAIEAMGVYALPVNSTLVKIIHKLKMQKDEAKVNDLCCACSKEEATRICFSCDPVGCRLCETCCNSEHQRRFAPVRSHKPILIEQAKRVPKNKCNIHHYQSLTHFSETTGTFACQKCLDSQPDIKASYVKVDAVIQTQKSRVATVMQDLDDYLKRLEDSQNKISAIQSQLLEIGPKAIQDIQKQFADFQIIFQKRQNALLRNTDTYVSESNLYILS